MSYKTLSQPLSIGEIVTQAWYNRKRENAEFIEGKAIHGFEELTAILDYVPAGWESEEEGGESSSEEIDEDDEMPGRRHRNEFRQPFDDAEQQGGDDKAFSRGLSGVDRIFLHDPRRATRPAAAVGVRD